MRLPGLFVSVALCATPALPQSGPAASPQEVAHVTGSFHFAVHAAMARVAPLFGPEGERNWAGAQWNPFFLYPVPASDVQGSVFTVQHGSRASVWVNTIFDPRAGRMQYVVFVPDVMVETIDVRLSSADAGETAVDVTYVRTALQPAANDRVREMAEKDRESGPEWRDAVGAYLRGK